MQNPHPHLPPALQLNKKPANYEPKDRVKFSDVVLALATKQPKNRFDMRNAGRVFVPD
jgi:hypothetical protein